LFCFWTFSYQSSCIKSLELIFRSCWFLALHDDSFSGNSTQII
jgi:hypothetical protein